jgi:DNA-binding NtrC family response regulator
MAQTGAIPVLIVDDEESQRSGLASLVSTWNFTAKTAANGQEALEALASFPAHVIVTDLVMPVMDGYELLRRLAGQTGAPPVIVLTAFGSIESAVSVVHELGAFWFVEKPIDPATFRLLLERAASLSRLSLEAESLQRRLSQEGVLGELAGRSARMQEVFSLIRQVAPTTASVLITGESGTGKELVARAIHHLSPRRDSPLVVVNCAALPESLIESELFGHEKGAFTGAVERRAGSFELAQSGTLMLDEIGDMPLASQSKLLRVLEDSRVRRLGAKAEILVDVRVLAATNRMLEEAMHKGQFREDLYYRLNVFTIGLPPLRERKEDIPLLVEALLGDLNGKHGAHVTGIHPAVLERFTAHDWPGNVRELRNALERALIMAGDGEILAQHLPPLLRGPAGAPAAAEGEADVIRVPLGSTVDEAEKLLIRRTLAHAGNNKTRAAAILDISLKTLHNKLKEYGSSDGEA